MRIIFSPPAGSDPEAALERELAAGAAAADCLIAVPWVLQRYWQRPPEELHCTALYRVRPGAEGAALQLALLEGPCPPPDRLAALWEGADALPVFALDAPLSLAPVEIPKPWGAEWWYTGIEERGQAKVVDPQRRGELSLPWLLEAAPRRLTAMKARRLVLLKTLHPFADPLFGDLYFEFHEEKRELYVVTGVDADAWPQGQGAIRFGFEDRLRRRYPDDDAFRGAFVKVVGEYEQIRRRIDAALEERAGEQSQNGATLSLAARRRLLETLPRPWLREEQRRRQRMMGFTALRPVAPGDVLQVPLRVPHALQHGVRVVEFQNPVYERRILFFTQKVRTQEHWDTRQGARLMSLDTPPAPPLRVLHEEEGVRVERIAAYGDFEARRLRLAPGARYPLAGRQEAAVVITAAGEARLQGAGLPPEQALLLPASWRGGELYNPADEEAVLLLAWGHGGV